jgi:hypothetical protein
MISIVSFETAMPSLASYPGPVQKALFDGAIMGGEKLNQ